MTDSDSGDGRDPAAGETGRRVVDGQERELRPAVRRRDESDDSGDDAEGITEGLETVGPLEPQEIDAENAMFVLLGVVFVVGFLLAAIAGF